MFHPDPYFRNVIINLYNTTLTFNIPICLLTVYIVIYHSPKSMTTYKWLQVNILLSALLFDIIDGSACVVLVPRYIGFYWLRDFRSITIAPAFMNFGITFYVSFVLLQGYSIFLALFFRLYKISAYPFQQIMKRKGKIMFGVVYGTIPLFQVFMWLQFFGSPNETTESITLNDTILQPLKNENYVFIYSYELIWIKLFVVGICMVIFFIGVPILLTALAIAVTLEMNGMKMSVRTLRLQRQMFYSLTAQMTILLGCYVLSFGLYVLTLIGQTWVPDPIAALAGLATSPHTTLNCIITISFTKPYRDVLLNLLKTVQKVKLIESVQTSFVSVQNRRLSVNPNMGRIEVGVVSHATSSCICLAN